MELVSGQTLRAETHSDLLMAIMNEPLTLGAEGAEWRRLETVLRRAVAKDPSARYQSAGALSAELLPALRGLPSIAPLAGIDPGPTGV